MSVKVVTFKHVLWIISSPLTEPIESMRNKKDVYPPPPPPPPPHNAPSKFTVDFFFSVSKKRIMGVYIFMYEPF